MYNVHKNVFQKENTKQSLTLFNHSRYPPTASFSSFPFPFQFIWCLCRTLLSRKKRMKVLMAVIKPKDC